MKKLATWMAMLATVVGVGGVGGARAATCEPEVAWGYCGEHVPLSKLPLLFTYAGGAPAITCNALPSQCSVTQAIDDAMLHIDLAWPGTKVCNPLCRRGSTGNTISWAGLGASGPVAYAALQYESPGSKRIVGCDVVLNSAKKWRFAGGADLATGEVNAVTANGMGGRLPSLGDWYDIKSALTHELVHCLGPEDIGSTIPCYPDPEPGPFPCDLTDAWKYLQTMYRWYFPGTTNKQTLDWGDLVGLHRAAADSYADR